jgi:hypothetical protein
MCAQRRSPRPAVADWPPSLQQARTSRGDVLRQRQPLKLGGASDRLVEGSAEAFCGFGGVLGEVASEVLVRQLTRPGRDRPEVELARPTRP